MLQTVLPGRRSLAICIALMFIAPSVLLASGLASSGRAEPGPIELNDGVWGGRETFDHAVTGSQGTIGDVSLYPGPKCDAVVLDGTLWLMYRGNESRMIAKYQPSVAASAWNISFEAYTPRDRSSYQGVGQVPGVYSLRALLNDTAGVPLVGVELRVSEEGTEGIYCYDPGTTTWERVKDRVLPALVHRTAEHGLTPERYVVSFSFDGASTVQVTVTHTSGSVIFVRTVGIVGPAPSPVLRFYDNVAISQLVNTTYGVNGGWFLDNLGARSLASRYPLIEPSYIYVPKDGPVWLTVHDGNGGLVEDAVVTIAGWPATYDPEDGRYEAFYPRPVDWAVATDYVVNLDGVEVSGRYKVTTTEADPLASVTKWWNGWDWATVFGLDDCSGPASALVHYQGYDHPTTAYVMSVLGNSSDVLPTQSEIGLHQPHDYTTWMKKSWTESVSDAATGQAVLSSYYDYASRWDDPTYVGSGDTYISMANPGNSATYQMMYAQYAAGMRIEGIGSNHYNGAPGNASLLGCYFLRTTGIDPYIAWDPTSPYDLMDSSRQWNTDYSGQTYERVKLIAEAGGLFRIYAHPGYPIRNADIMHWIDDAKTNYSLENWKATDGEAASYTYGRWTTDVARNAVESTDDTLVFDVERQDPRAAGYWLVPVTIAIDVGGMDVKRVEVVEGGRTYSSDGAGEFALRDLDGARIMDLGYDLRGETLYVSHFWNSTAQLRIVFNYTHPIISGTPDATGEIGNVYFFNATASPANAGSNVWTLDNGSASWLGIVSSDQGNCRLSGVPTQAGNYSLALSVQDDDSVSTMSWTVFVPEKVPPSILTTPEPMVIEREWYDYQAVCDQPVSEWTVQTDAGWLQMIGNGTLSGTAAKMDVGSVYSVSIRAVCSNGTAYQNFTVEVLNVQPQFITVPTLQIKFGESYEYLPATDEDAFGVMWTGLATNATFPYEFNASSGRISFQGTVSGIFHFQLSVSDLTGAANQTAVQEWSVTVLPAPAPAIVGTPQLVAVEDSLYRCDFDADQPVGSWTLETDADWLSITSEGTVQGTPSNRHAYGSFFVHLTAENANGSSQINYTIDVVNAAPAFITVPAAEGVVGEPYVYTAALDDQDGGFFVILTTNLTCPYHFDASNGTVWFTPTEPGMYWLDILANDGSGAANSSVSQHWTVTIPVPPVIDFTPPETWRDVNGTASSGWYPGPVTVGLTASDDVTGVNYTEYRLDGSDWTIYSGPISIEGDGNHVLQYRSVDMAGNSESAIVLDVPIDSGAPTTSVMVSTEVPGESGWYRGPVSIVINASDAWSGIAVTYVRWDGGEWSAATGTMGLSVDGVHVLNFYSVDVAGNPEAEGVLTVQIDSLAPVSTLVLSGPSRSPGLYNGTVQVEIGSSDNGSRADTIFLNVDGSGWIPYYGGFPMSGEGAHTIDYYCRDKAGNVEGTRSGSFVVDLTAPVSTAVLQGEVGLDGWYLGMVTAELVATDPLSGVWWTSYSLDDGEWSEVQGEVTVGADGVHMLHYRSIDLASNLEGAKALAFKIDGTAPQLSLDLDDGEVFTSTSVLVRWNASDATSGLDRQMIVLDGGPAIACDGDQYPLEGLTVGKHTVQVIAYDAAGNDVSATVSFTVDTSPFSPSSPSNSAIWVALGAVLAALALLGAVLFLRKGR